MSSIDPLMELILQFAKVQAETTEVLELLRSRIDAFEKRVRRLEERQAKY